MWSEGESYYQKKWKCSKSWSESSKQDDIEEPILGVVVAQKGSRNLKMDRCKFKIGSKKYNSYFFY